ncbi:MAG: hypothetical protein ACO20R_02415 [Burkholderiaceae bacterium]
MVIALVLGNAALLLWGSGALLRWGIGPQPQTEAVIIAPQRMLPATPSEAGSDVR